MGSRRDDQIDERVRRELANQLTANIAQSAIPLLVGIGCVALLLRDQVEPGPLRWWVLAAVLDTVRALVVYRIERRREQRSSDPSSLWRSVPNYLAFGGVWGSLELIAVHWGNERSLWISVIITLAMLTMYVVAVAPSRVLFAVGVVGMAVPGTAGLLTKGGIAATLGWATIAYYGVAVHLHNVLHRAVLASMRAKHTNQELAGQLQEFLDDRDALTGLLNRRGFLTHLDELADGGDRHQRILVAVANIQQLASVNELYGELVGDQLLVAFATRLASSMPTGCLLARLAGDEFAAATLLGRDSDELRRQLQRAVDDVFTVDGHRIQVELHTAHVVGKVRRAGDLVAEASTEVRRSRARVRPTLHHSDDPVNRRRELATQLRRGLEAGDIRPWFQPIVDANTRQLAAWEALVRWVHPTSGVIAPDRFLPLATMTGLSSTLTEVVLHRSLAFVGRLRTEVPGSATTMHVNMAPSDLRRVDIVGVVSHALQGHRVDASELVIEITEQSILELDVVTAANMHALTELGVHIAIDDFGTGFSSLGHLLDLPTGHLKIDRRFVSGLPDQRAATTLVQGVIGMARGMDMATVAEGVETESQAQLLVQLGCTQLQGYLVAPALPEHEAVLFARSLSGARSRD